MSFLFFTQAKSSTEDWGDGKQNNFGGKTKLAASIASATAVPTFIYSHTVVHWRLSNSPGCLDLQGVITAKAAKRDVSSSTAVVAPSRLRTGGGLEQLNNSVIPFKCSLCLEGFQRLKELSQHVTDHRRKVSVSVRVVYMVTEPPYVLIVVKCK